MTQAKSIQDINRMRPFFIIFIFLMNFVFSQRVIGYYPQWVLGNLPPSEIDFNVVTHVIHSFAWPNEDGSISSYDGMFGSGISNIIHDQGAKFLLSLGGWGNHAGFEVISGDSVLRELFIYNLVSILLVNNYDGVDLDWEFPDSNTDRENLNLLVSDMDSIFFSINPEWIISMAIPVSNWWGQWHDFEFLEEHVDFFNAMTYGTHGDWSSHVGHLAPLYPSPPDDLDGSCDENMNYLHFSRGVRKNKINMGMPFWGLKWEASNINEPFANNSENIFYYDIPELINNGWSYQWDGDALCPYLVKDDGSLVVTYENPESIAFKCQYVIEEGLGGVMIWALSYDKTEYGQELIHAISDNYLKSFRDKVAMPRLISLRTYPNPFNPLCFIKFELEKSHFVKIKVHDLLGNEIQLLNNKSLPSGEHRLLWDGEKHASGSYFINVEYDQNVISQKVTLIK